MSASPIDSENQTSLPDEAGEIVAVVDNEGDTGDSAPGWAELGTDPRIVEALTAAGMTAPFPIQAMTLPVAISGNDVIGQAKTGTGKTLGFGIPLLHRVLGPKDPGFSDLDKPGAPQALAIVPTRELATQVAEDLKVASKHLSLRVLTVYGGRAYEPQIEALKKGVEIVVGTPGRLLDLAQQGHLSLAHARTLVLDEADEMLDLGFLPDVEKLMSLTPDGRQTMLFSATMPGAVVSLARKYMTQPTHIRATDPDDSGATVLAIAQFIYRAHAMDKVEMLAKLLQAEGRGLSIIFTRTKRTAAKVAEELADRGFAAAAIHGDLGQGAREQALRAFRNGKIDVLVATDVAARGIDVENVTHVVNYACPEDEKTYLHRIGRTGRAGNTGVAVTFVDWDDLHRWMMIDKALDLGIPEPAETYSSSEHFFEDLNIPAGVKGTLPRAARTRAGLDAEELEDLGETGKRGGPPKRGDSKRDGGRGRSRDRDRDRGRESREDEAAEGTEEPREPRPARTRTRRRTRRGVPVEGAEPNGDGQADTDQDSAGQSDSDRDGAESNGSGSGRARRTRSRRGGTDRSGSGRNPAGTDEATENEAEPGGTGPDDAVQGRADQTGADQTGAADSGSDSEADPRDGADAEETGVAKSRTRTRTTRSRTAKAADGTAKATETAVNGAAAKAVAFADGNDGADDLADDEDGDGDAPRRRRRRRRGGRGSGSSSAPAENAAASAGSTDS